MASFLHIHESLQQVSCYSVHFYYITCNRLHGTVVEHWTLTVCSGRSLMAQFTCATKLDSGAQSAKYARTNAVRHVVSISRERNSGYRLSRVTIMAQGLSTSRLPFPPYTTHTIRQTWWCCATLH